MGDFTIHIYIYIYIKHTHTHTHTILHTLNKTSSLTNALDYQASVYNGSEHKINQYYYYCRGDGATSVTATVVITIIIQNNIK